MLNLIEAATGGRFHPNFDRIGGLKDDLPKGWIDETKAVMKKMRALLRRDGGPAHRQRDLPGPHPGHRRHPAGGRALATACRAPTCAASGVDWDLRRDQPLPMAWDKVDWKVWTHPDGDSFARVLGAAPGDPRGHQDRRPAPRHAARPGRSWPRCRASSRCPRARPGSPPRTRSARWATTSSRKGDIGPFRVKIRSASFNNISIAPWVLRGVYVPDVITILASLYFILGDIDR